MSLNTAHCNGGVVIHQGEVILLHASNAILSFSGSDNLKIGEKNGNAYLTTHRLIFLAGKGNNSAGSFQSFSFPFCVLSEVDVEQPVFGANYLKGKVRAQPDGNWRGEAKFKLVFKNGGAIDFAQGMVRAMQLAKQMTGQNVFWNTPPPSYSAATAPDSPYQQAPPSYYSSPNNYYGWMPPSYNFPQPDAGTVFVSEAPPPYPGIGVQAPPQQSYYPPQQPQAYSQQPPSNPYGDYPQQNGGFPQQNGGYPQQNGGYPQQTAGYPQQTEGYPQQTAGFPQQTAGYPQQNGGYPQQTAGFPQQNGGYTPQNVGYPQQTGGYPYPQQQFANSGASQATGFYPPTNGFYSSSAPPPPYDFDPSNKKNN